MARIIAIDYGLKRVGLAVTDREGLVPFPLKTVAPEVLFVFLRDYFKKEDVEKIILGFPGDIDQDEDIVMAINKLCVDLKKKFPSKPVFFVDERYTSRIASSYAYRLLSKKDRRDKGAIDMISAVLILQSYLNKGVLS